MIAVCAQVTADFKFPGSMIVFWGQNVLLEPQAIPSSKRRLKHAVVYCCRSGQFAGMRRTNTSNLANELCDRCYHFAAVCRHRAADERALRF